MNSNSGLRSIPITTTYAPSNIKASSINVHKPALDIEDIEVDQSGEEIGEFHSSCLPFALRDLLCNQDLLTQHPIATATQSDSNAELGSVNQTPKFSPYSDTQITEKFETKPFINVPTTDMMEKAIATKTVSDIEDIEIDLHRQEIGEFHPNCLPFTYRHLLCNQNLLAQPQTGSASATASSASATATQSNSNAMLGKLNCPTNQNRLILHIYTCNICGKIFKYKNTLATHMAVIHSMDKSYVCNICDKKFSSKNSLKRHQMIHTGHPKFCCNICKKHFLHNFALIRHKEIHLKYKDRTYHICDICHNKFLNRSSLHEHKQIKHSNNTLRYSCSICNKSFTAQHYLQMHKHRVHFKVNHYSCDRCGKTFSQKGCLARHKKRQNPCIDARLKTKSIQAADLRTATSD